MIPKFLLTNCEYFTKLFTLFCGFVLANAVKRNLFFCVIVVLNVCYTFH